MSARSELRAGLEAAGWTWVNDYALEITAPSGKVSVYFGRSGAATLWWSITPRHAQSFMVNTPDAVVLAAALAAERIAGEAS